MNRALLVIDVQKIYTDSDSELYCEEAQSTVGNVNRLVKHFQDRKEPIFLIRHVHKEDGSDLGRMFDYAGDDKEGFDFVENTEEVEYDESLERPSEAIELVKARYSAFVGTGLQRLLQDREVGRIVVCGFMTNFCCDGTARTAHDLDYFVDFVLDATGTPGTENLNQARIREAVGETLESGIAEVVGSDEFVKKY